MTTAYVTDARFATHTQRGHPEHAGRLTAIQRVLDEQRLSDRFLNITATPVDEESLLEVHTPRYLALLDLTIGRSASMLGMDTYVTPESYPIARLAAGGMLRVIDAVLTGKADNGLAAIRPPGHHATPSQAMGFCLLNNVAVAARYARRQFDLERVAIIDYDVHHGNGTQDVFYFDPAVLYISTHQSPLYPGTGDMDETGAGDGAGCTVNIPLPPGVGDEGYATVFEQIILPAVQRFRPQLLLVSAGFDAHWADPLANMRLSLTGYDHLARQVVALADDLCQGRVVFLLEGGYDLQALSYGWANVGRALLGEPPAVDHMGLVHGSSPRIDQLIEHLRHLHKLG